MTTLNEAVERALAWLEANPDKHIAGNYATAEGRAVSPLDPDADCFCVVGRVACELNLDAFDTEQLFRKESVDDFLMIENIQDDLIEADQQAEAIVAAKQLMKEVWNDQD